MTFDLRTCFIIFTLYIFQSGSFGFWEKNRKSKGRKSPNSCFIFPTWHHDGPSWLADASCCLVAVPAAWCEGVRQQKVMQSFLPDSISCSFVWMTIGAEAVKLKFIPANRFTRVNVCSPCGWLLYSAAPSPWYASVRKMLRGGWMSVSLQRCVFLLPRGSASCCLTPLICRRRHLVLLASESLVLFFLSVCFFSCEHLLQVPLPPTASSKLFCYWLLHLLLKLLFLTLFSSEFFSSS